MNPPHLYTKDIFARAFQHKQAALLKKSYLVRDRQDIKLHINLRKTNYLFWEHLFCQKGRLFKSRGKLYFFTINKMNTVDLSTI